MSDQSEKVREAREKIEKIEAGLGGLLPGLGGLSQLVSKLSQLADTAETLQEQGEFQTEKKATVSYNVRVRTGLDGMGSDSSTPPVTPVNQNRPEPMGREATVEEVREPMVDIFEEESYLLLVAEMPGIGAEDVRLESAEDVLTLRAEKGAKRYRKEILLPGIYSVEKMKITANNGMIEIRCEK